MQTDQLEFFIFLYFANEVLFCNLHLFVVIKGTINVVQVLHGLKFITKVVLTCDLTESN